MFYKVFKKACNCEGRCMCDWSECVYTCEANSREQAMRLWEENCRRCKITMSIWDVYFCEEVPGVEFWFSEQLNDGTEGLCYMGRDMWIRDRDRVRVEAEMGHDDFVWCNPEGGEDGGNHYYFLELNGDESDYELVG